MKGGSNGSVRGLAVAGDIFDVDTFVLYAGRRCGDIGRSYGSPLELAPSRYCWLDFKANVIFD